MRGADHPTGASQFGVGEDLRRVVRRIVDRRHAERQRGVVDPALLRDDLVRPHRTVPVGVDDAGNDGLAGHIHDDRRRRERVTSLRGPMASMRLPLVTMTPSSMTRSPFMVMMRAPVRARRPSGLSAACWKPRLIPVSGGLGSSAGAPSTKAKPWFRSRLNSCGPSDQLRLLEFARPRQPVAGVAREPRLRQGLAVRTTGSPAVPSERTARRRR